MLNTHQENSEFLTGINLFNFQNISDSRGLISNSLPSGLAWWNFLGLLKTNWIHIRMCSGLVGRSLFCYILFCLFNSVKMFNDKKHCLLEPEGKDQIGIIDEMHSSFLGTWCSLGWGRMEESKKKAEQRINLPLFLIGRFEEAWFARFWISTRYPHSSQGHHDSMDQRREKHLTSKGVQCCSPYLKFWIASIGPCLGPTLGGVICSSSLPVCLCSAA